MKKQAKSEEEWAQYKRDQYSTREQQKEWDEHVKSQQEWNAKPKAERVADARYVLRWSPAIAKTVSDGNVWMADAIRICQEIEKTVRSAGFESREEMEAFKLDETEGNVPA
jgi:hypothetical protein